MQAQVHVPMGAEGVEQVEERGAAGDGGEAEQRDALGHALGHLAGPQGGQAAGQQLGRRWLPDAVPHRPEELGLPAGVGGERGADLVAVVAGGPGPHHARPVEQVAVEQVGQAAGPTPAGGARRQAQRRAQAVVLGLVLDHGQHPPHQPVEGPRVVLVIGAQEPPGQPAGVEQVEVGGHAVASALARGPQPTGQGEAEPALHAGGDDHDPLGGQGVGHRARQDAGQVVGQGVEVGIRGHPEHVGNRTGPL